MKLVQWFSGLSIKARVATALAVGAAVIVPCVAVGVATVNNTPEGINSSTEENVDSSVFISSINESALEEDSKGNSSIFSGEESFEEESSTVETSQESSVENSFAESSKEADSADSESVVPHEHDFSLGIVGEEFLHAVATCDSKATYYYACLCGEHGEETFEYGSTLEHDIKRHEAQAPTCVEIGWEEYETCTRCGYTTYAEISATGEHVWDEGEITTQPTCVAEGVKTFTCNVCETATKTEVVGVTPHGYAEEWTADETQHWRACVCGEKTDEGEHTEDPNGVCVACGYVFPFTTGVVYEYSKDGTYAIVTGYEGSATEVKIADSYNGVPVTEIAKNVFYNCAVVERIVIGANVTVIGECAFQNCTKLTDVVIADSVREIGSLTFAYCVSLTEITIGKGVHSLGKDLFYGCESLTGITFADTTSWYWTTSSTK